RIHVIRLEDLRRERDQLFAEAVYRFRQGERWWPDNDFEQTKIAVEQEARFEADIWREPITLFLRGKTETTMMEIVIGALGYEPPRPDPVYYPNEPKPLRGTPINRVSPADQRRITAVLMHLGWSPKRDNTRRWWERTVKG